MEAALIRGALRSVAGLPAGHWIWPVFGVAYGLGVWGGHQVQQPWILGREGAKVRLAGESLTLGLMMVVFWANFLGGVLRAVAPLLYQNPMFHLGFACILALSAGSFAGRALAVWRRI